MRVTGGGFLFTGAWADAFVDDGHGYAYGVRERLRHLAQSAEDIDPATIDERASVRMAGPPVAAVHGEIEGLQRTAYVERWVEQVTPLLASQALRTLAKLPGVPEVTAARLDEEAERAVRGIRVGARWLLLRSGQVGIHPENRAICGVQDSRTVALTHPGGKMVVLRRHPDPILGGK